MPFTRAVNRLRLIMATAAVLAVANPRAEAHPHSWIDIETTVILTKDSRIGAVQVRWTFDEYYSADLMRQTGGMQAFAESALVNLAPYGYFTRMKAGESRLEFGQPKDVAAHLTGKRLVLEFTLPLARPFGSGAVVLSIFDPSYYIDMRHEDARSIRFDGTGAERCHTRIVEAKPSEATRRRAMAMDRQATPDLNLGEQFAQLVEIDCQ